MQNGGLKMPNIFIKVKAWQLSWLLRAVKKPNSAWLSIVNEILAKMKLQDLIHCDLEKNMPLLLRLPVFYQNILHSWIELKPHCIIVQEIYNQTLWFNKNITINGQSFLWQNWYDKGILFIKDIITENGDFLSEDQIKDKYDVKTNFLQVLQIRQSIALQSREELKTVHFVPVALKPVISIKRKNTDIPITKIKSFVFYKKLLELHCKNIQPKCKAKWNESYNISDLQWSNYFKNTFKICRSTKLQTFQYRINHRIITCNHWLFNAKIKISPECETCKVDDTLQHFFVNCEKVKMFWIEFKTWWSLMTESNYGWQLTEKDILLGTLTNKSLDFVILLAKKMIHDTNLSPENISPTFPTYLNILKQHLDYERQICLKNDDFTSFVLSWGWLYDQLG